MNEPKRALLDFADGHQMIMSAEYTDGRPTIWLIDEKKRRELFAAVLRAEPDALANPIPKKEFRLVAQHRNGTLRYREVADV